MKKNLFLFAPCVLFLVFMNLPKNTFSQNVGIGTNNPLNKLHVAGGFRLDTLVEVAGSGILQHNGNGVISSLKFTGNIADVLRGNGTFGAAGSGSSAVWMLNGNAGTNPSTDFIGTTDAQPLVFRVKNQPSGLIDSALNNTAFGFKTLASNTTGASNTVNGYKALDSNTTGSFNTASGSFALSLNTKGSYNTATGATTLQINTTGKDNTATGARTLYFNTTGYDNTATGFEALNLNTTGYYNTATGAESLYYNTIGYNNTANGYAALYHNTTGYNNTANGYFALFANQTGHENSANGYNALNANTTGFYNTASGIAALNLNTSGSYNSASGSYALYSNTTGNFNTALGYSADVSTGTLSNATALGNNAIVNASNKIRLGNAAVTVIEGQVAYSYPSDGRFKTNISEHVKGLDFIMRLRPIVYNFQTKKYEEFVTGKTNKDAKFAASIDYSESEKIRHNGFIAQEVEKAAKESGYEFDGVVTPKNDKETYGLSYSQFVVPLVKAMQEQQKIIDDIKKQVGQSEMPAIVSKQQAIIEDQQKQIDELTKEVHQLMEKMK